MCYSEAVSSALISPRGSFPTFCQLLRVNCLLSRGGEGPVKVISSHGYPHSPRVPLCKTRVTRVRERDEETYVSVDLIEVCLGRKHVFFALEVGTFLVFED